MRGLFARDGGMAERDVGQQMSSSWRCADVRSWRSAAVEQDALIGRRGWPADIALRTLMDRDVRDILSRELASIVEIGPLTGEHWLPIKCACENLVRFRCTLTRSLTETRSTRQSLREAEYARIG